MAFLNRAVVNTQKWVSWKLNPIPGTILDFNLAIAIFIIDLLVGITGFMWLEGFAFIDAIYQTVITISTVGFTEVKKLDDTGKIFVSLYILFNIGVFAYILSVFSYYVIQGEIFKTMHLNHVKSAIEQLNNHVIVCGFGKYGKEITQHFLQHKNPSEYRSKCHWFSRRSRLLPHQSCARCDPAAQYQFYRIGGQTPVE